MSTSDVSTRHLEWYVVDMSSLLSSVGKLS